MFKTINSWFKKCHYTWYRQEYARARNISLWGVWGGILLLLGIAIYSNTIRALDESARGWATPIMFGALLLIFVGLIVSGTLAIVDAYEKKLNGNKEEIKRCH
jgi:hypothetical protein